MNEKEPFIIEDMDEYHLIIKADEEYRVRKELEAEVRTPTSLRRLPFQKCSFSLAGKEYVQLGSRSMTTAFAPERRYTHLPTYESRIEGC